jgi:hypothetical protein
VVACFSRLVIQGDRKVTCTKHVTVVALYVTFGNYFHLAKMLFHFNHQIQLIIYILPTHMFWSSLDHLQVVTPLAQGDRKVTQPVLDTCAICQKINYIQIRKKQGYIKCWKCPPLSAMHAFTLCLMFDATRWRVSAVTGNGSPDEILSNCLAQENREMYP